MAMNSGEVRRGHPMRPSPNTGWDADSDPFPRDPNDPNSIFGGGGAPINTGGYGGDPLPATQIGNGYIPPVGLPSEAGFDAGLFGLGGGLTSLLGRPGGGFNATDLLKLLIGGGTALGGALANRGPSYPPELDNLLKLQRQRMESQNPLYQSILQLAQNRMPIGR